MGVHECFIQKPPEPNETFSAMVAKNCPHIYDELLACCDKLDTH